MAAEDDIGVRATALANLWRFGEAPWEGYADGATKSDHAQLRRAAAYSLARSARPQARPALRRLAADEEAVIRATAVAGLRRAPLTAADVDVVARAVSDPDIRVRTAACAVLAEQKAPALPTGAAAAVAQMWRSPHPHLAVMALRAAGANPEIGEAAVLAEIAVQEDSWPASQALAALAGRGDDAAAEIAGGWLGEGSLWQRRAVAAIAAELGETFEKASFSDEAPAVRLAWVENLTAEALPARLDVLEGLVAEDPDPAVRAAALGRLSAAGEAAGFDELLVLAHTWRSDELADARGAALAAALEKAADDDQRQQVFETAMGDVDPVVAILVANAARERGLRVGFIERAPRHNHRWYLELTDWMRDRHWLDVTTDRGTFRIRLESEETPITAREIFDLADAGFYDGLTFHRVVPNFVVQTGDPRGDGWGGPGFVLPDEAAFQPFDTYRVGLAHSGPNTGGSQLFVTLMPADHLVGHYTNLGDVVAGKEVLSRLRAGDRIRGIETHVGDEPPPPVPVLLGELEWRQLAELPGWQAERDSYEPDPAVLDLIGTAVGTYRVVTVLGTWCSDSRREVPRLVEILDRLETPVFEHEMVGVDRTRRVDDAELAASIAVERTVERVATIVVFDADGVELGRVVETAEKPLEELLVDFLAPIEGW
jgi:cyclophilin family peptidyl-prolyl cis-trans isomerase